MKNNPNPNPNPNHCSSSFLLPVIKLFCSFEKKNTINTTRIRHFIQHADTTRKFQEDSNIKQDPFAFSFFLAEKKNL